MKSGYMKKIYMGTIGDMKNLEQHYSHMAEQGWMIDKIGVFTHHYRAIEPCKKIFFVDLLPQITAFDYPENEDAKDYRSICEESGWTFISANKQFHVFCADGENSATVPIHTDNSIQAKIYLKACRKYEILGLFYLLFVFWLTSPIGRGAEFLLSNMILFTSIGYFLFLIGAIWTFAAIISWYMKTKKSAKENLPLPKVNYRLSKLRNKMFLFGAVATILCLIIGIVLDIAGGRPVNMMLTILIAPISGLFVGLCIRRMIDTQRRTRSANITIAILAIVILEILVLGYVTFAISRTPSWSHRHPNDIGNRQVLTLNDLGVVEEPNDYASFVRSSVAVPVNYIYWESHPQGSVDMHLYRSINKKMTQWLYDDFAKEFTKRFDNIYSTTSKLIVFTPDEAAIWGAEKGMTIFSEGSTTVQLLLLNDKSILSLRLSSENMTLETISQAVQNLWND